MKKTAIFLPAPLEIRSAKGAAVAAWSGLFLMGFIALVWASPAFAQVPDDIIEKIKPSVAVIYCDNGTGTGYMINAKGDILTNYHICSASPRLWVRLYDGRRFEARRIFIWEFKDMAIWGLLPNSPENKPVFPYLILNDTVWIANDSAVAAIGHNKHGFWQVIKGRVKSKDHYVKYQPTILYGFSGSPLINENGYVVGLNIGSDNRDVSVVQDGFYSSAVTLNDMQEFLDYFYGRKTIAKPEPPALIDVFADKCVWQKTKEGQWCKH